MSNHAARTPASPAGGADQFIGEIVPRVAGAIPHVTRTPADRKASLLAALRGEEERSASADERADHEPRAEEANPLPVDGAAIRLSARTFDGRGFVFGLGEAATKGAHGVGGAALGGRWWRFSSPGRLPGAGIGE